MGNPPGGTGLASGASRGPTFELRAGGRQLLARRVEPTARAGEATLVFLHEGLGCIGFWKRFPERLCDRLGLPGLVYDRWGYGGSEPFDRKRTPRYLHDEAELFLPEVLDACGVRRPVLVGHSDGGSIALLFAAALPDRPAAVVTIAAHVSVEREALAGIRAAVAAYREGGLRRTLERFHGAKADSVMEAWAGIWLSPGFRAWNVEGALPRVRAPVLVLQGEADEYGTPLQVEAIARGVRGPVEAHLLPGLGHAPHLQGEKAVLDRCNRFVRQHLGIPSGATPAAKDSVG